MTMDKEALIDYRQPLYFFKNNLLARSSVKVPGSKEAKGKGGSL